jgi:hypothetical protein
VNAKAIKNKPPLRVYKVYLRDGREFPVDAATWARQYQPEDEIKFFDDKGKAVEGVFVRAPDTSAVAPESSLSISPPIAVLQNDVKVLESRVDALERNQSGLREMIERAVESSIESAFAKRGM